MAKFKLLYILLFGALIRIIVLIIGSEFMTLPNGGADALVFEEEAWMLSEFGRQDISTYLIHGSSFLSFLSSYVYDVVGRSPYTLGMLMVLLGTATIYVSYLAALALWSNVRAARAVALAVALFPQLIIHSALLLRETPVTFCLAMAALYVVQFAKHNKMSSVFHYVFWIGLGALFHSAVIIAIPALPLAMILARPSARRGRGRFYLVNLAAAGILGGAIFVANSTGYGMGKFGGGLEETMETFETREMRGVEGNAAFPEWMRIRGGPSDLWKIPVRLITFTFAPLIPFLVRNSTHLPGLIDAGLYLYLAWLIFKHRKIVKANRPAYVLLLITLLLFLAYSMGVSNFGTAIRHRAKIVVLLIIIAAGLAYVKKRTKTRSIRPDLLAQVDHGARPSAVAPTGFFSQK